MTRTLLLATACLATPLAAHAQTPPVVEEVVVTADRLPPEAEPVAGVRVIDETEIATRGAVLADDVLETLPGVNVTRNGGLGGFSGVRLRGMTPDKTLVLVDGVVLNDPASPSGGFDFSGFDLADVRRVELLSGPQGSLWGSDAIGGVISFTTRELDGVRAAAEAGSYGTLRGSAAVGRATDRYAIGASVAGLTADGFSKAAIGSEDDGFDTYTLSLNGRVEAAERLTLDARVRFTDSEVDIDGYDADFAFGDTLEVSRSEQISGFVRARLNGALGLDHTLSVSAYDIDRETTGGLFPSGFAADRQAYRYVGERTGDRYALAFGAEREDIEATLSDGASAEQGATSAFATLRVEATDRLTLSGSARIDDPDEYDAETTLRAAAALDLGGGFSATAGYGQGFKTPTISQTACDFCFPAGPSVGLTPERAEGIDLSLAWASTDGRYDAAVTAYRIEVEDQITFTFDPVTFDSRYANVDETRSEGVEIEGSAVLGGGFAARATYAYTDAEDRGTGLPLLRTPEHQASAVVTYARERWDGALTLRAESEQADSDPSTFARTERDGFVVVDLAGAYALTDGVALTLRVDNLLDEKHQQVLGYAETGLAGYVGLRMRR